MKPSSRPPASRAPALALLALALATMLLPGPAAADGPHGHHGGDRGGDRWMGPPPPMPPLGDRRGRMGMRRPDQDAAYAATREGAVLPLRQIEGRVVPRMPGASYLGPEFDSGSGTYRLKFMSRGAVSWIDVDGRTGAIIGRSGE